MSTDRILPGANLEDRSEIGVKEEENGDELGEKGTLGGGNEYYEECLLLLQTDVGDNAAESAIMREKKLKMREKLLKLKEENVNAKEGKLEAVVNAEVAKEITEVGSGSEEQLTGFFIRNNSSLLPSSSAFLSSSSSPSSDSVAIFNKSLDGEIFAMSRKGILEEVERLIDLGANPNSKYGLNDSTPLHAASLHGRLEVVKLLLDRGADVNAKDKYQNTPLHTASRWGNLETVKLLLDRGGDLNAKGWNDQSLLHMASQGGYLKVVKYLLDRGVDPNSKDIAEYTPLHLACKYYLPFADSLQVVMVLLDRGGDLLARDKRFGFTPLRRAEMNSKAVDVVKMIYMFAGATSQHRLIWAATWMEHIGVYHEFRGTQVVIDLYDFLFKGSATIEYSLVILR